MEIAATSNTSSSCLVGEWFVGDRLEVFAIFRVENSQSPLIPVNLNRKIMPVTWAEGCFEEDVQRMVENFE